MAVNAPAGGRLVAWAGFAFGSVMSIAANVLYTWIPHPPEGVDPRTWVAPAGWAPSIPAQIGSAAWPVALLLAVETLSRVRWRAGWQWKLARYGGAGLVALGAAIISYGHLNAVLLEWGYDAIGAAVGPLVIDGLMTISGFALLSMSDHETDSTRAAQTTDQPARIPRGDTGLESELEPLEPAEETTPTDAEWSRLLDENGLSRMWDTAPLAVVTDPEVKPTREPRSDVCAAQPQRPAGNLAELTAKYDLDHDRTVALLAEGAGRGTLIKELGVSAHAARELAAAYKGAAA
ncbi:hypothetical protein ACQPZQ_02350 [Pseudonocardia sp. CA-142604]|uniref:hypothetical protein n=1 Tax=Pseudonocardia sp. CA-142604 TaxID=3240024 RepID=UPI003D8B77F7